MSDAKLVGLTLLANCKLFGKQSPKKKAEKSEMMKILYASAVGSLMYAMMCTRTDIEYAVGVVNRFMSNTGSEHMAVVKWIVRYLKGTFNMFLRFRFGKPLLEGFTNLNMSPDVDTSKSTYGYIMTYVGGAISWQSRL